MSKVNSILLLVLLLSSALAGCGGSASSGGRSSTLTVWYSTDDPVERAWSQTLAHRFTATHPHIKVQLVDYSFEDINTKLQLALSGGTPPDLAYVTPRGPGIPAYVSAHRLLDLTAPARQNRWAAQLRPGLLQEYNQPFSYVGAKPGHIVAVPMVMAAVGMMVNQRLLHRLHLSIPRTLAQFEADLAVAKRAGYTPLGMGNEDGWLGDDWYLSLVNSLVPPAKLQPALQLSPSFSFKLPPFLQASRTIDSWARKGYFTKNFGGLDAQEGVDLFFRGSTLFQMVSSSENAQIMQDERETHLPVSVFGFPAQYGGTVSPQSGYEGWIVPQASRHAREAEAFISSLLTPNTGRFLLAQGAVPAERTTSQAGGRVAAAPSGGSSFPAAYLRMVDSSTPGVYLDAAPIANINATMEANIQLLLHGYEPPTFLVKSLQECYATRGKNGSTQRIDGEF